MVLPSEKPDQEKAADYRTYKYSQLLSVIVKFTIVNDCACQDGGKATRLTADQRIPVRFRVLASWCNHEYQSPENIRSTLRAGRDQGIFRDALPTGLTVAQETALRQKIAELKGIIADLEDRHGTPKVTKIAGTLDVRSREEQYINIHPIQAAGRLTTEARKALISYGDGYLPVTSAASRSVLTRSRGPVSPSSTKNSRNGSTWTRPGSFPVPGAGSRL